MGNFSYVFTGNNANDGTGTPLRTAFQIIDQNFANIIIPAPTSIVETVAGRSGNVVLSVNDIIGAVSIGYFNDTLNNLNLEIGATGPQGPIGPIDRKSTRLNSSH